MNVTVRFHLDDEAVAAIMRFYGFDAATLKATQKRDLTIGWIVDNVSADIEALTSPEEEDE